jgi:hypothetical protein
MSGRVCLQISISLAEALDKLSILQIKKKYISDKEKLADVENEIKTLCSEIQVGETSSYEYNCLFLVNEYLWHLMDLVSGMSPADKNYNSICKRIFTENDARSRIKYKINTKCNSKIRERKGYEKKVCNFISDSIHPTIVKIYVEYLSFYYDEVLVDDSSVERTSGSFTNVRLSDITNYDLLHLINTNLNSDFSTQNYICSGAFGDLIHVLYVIKCNYLTGNKKGVLYLGKKHFNDVDRTFSDFKSYSSCLEYISDVRLLSDTVELPPDTINLDLWRNYVYQANWIDMLCRVYSLPKLRIATIYPTKLDFSNFGKVVIHRSVHRNNSYMDYKSIISSVGADNVVFISSDISEYNKFVGELGFKINHVTYKSLEEFANLVSNCECFIGNQSSPLATVYSMNNVKCVGELFGIDRLHYIGLESANPEFKYIA